ncbi:MAG: hypothetical protein Q9198_002117 [Flavoplaca austrocitrina]
MDTWTRADGAGVSSTPEDMSRFFDEYVFGTEVFHASGGGFPINQTFYDANDTVSYQLANNNPSWNGISNPSGADTYQQYSTNFDFANYESHGMVGGQPLERTELPHGPEMQEYILQPTDSALALSGQGDTSYSSSKPKRTFDHHAPARESSNLQRTHQNTLFAEPSSVYGNPSLSVDELNDRPYVSTRPRPAKGTENTPTEKKKERTSKEQAIQPETKVVHIDGRLYVQSVSGARRLAVYHSDIRADLVAQASPHLYTHLPASGVDNLDVTTYYEPHRDWGFDDRKDRPEACFEWLRRGDPTVQKPGFMMHGDSIVLDHFTDLPIQDLPMPSCISTEIEGGRMEAMIRMHGHQIITKEAIRARMPKIPREAARKMINTLGMRVAKFRSVAGLPSSNPKGGSSAKKFALVQCIPIQTMEQILIENSIRSFRDLNDKETSYIKAATQGSKPEKAGSRETTSEKRAKLHAKSNKSKGGYEPVNPKAEPFGEKIDDDQAAVNAAQARRRSSYLLHPMHDKPTEPQEVAFNIEPHVYRIAPSTGLEGVVEEDPKMVPATHPLASSRGRKRSEMDETQPSQGHADADKRQRLTFTHNDDQVRAACRQVQPIDYAATQDEFGLISYDPPPANLEETGFASDIGGLREAGWPSHGDHSQTDLVIGEQPLDPSGNLYAFGNNRNQNDQSSLDHPTGSFCAPSIQGPTSIDSATVQTHSDSLVSRDYRFTAPENDDQASIIEFYLRFSIDDVVKTLEVQPPVSCRGESYAFQWQMLWRWYSTNCAVQSPKPICFCTKPWDNDWPWEEASKFRE